MKETLVSALQEARAALLNPELSESDRAHVVKVIEGAVKLQKDLASGGHPYKYSQISRVPKAAVKGSSPTKVVVLRAAFGTPFGATSIRWNLLMPRGEFHGANLAPIGGSINVDDSLLSELVANWKDAGSPPLPIRKTHRHLDDDVPAVDRLELEKSYGFLTDLRVTTQGLEVQTEWNAAGKAEVDGGSFAFWSPEWQPKHRDRRTGDMKGWWLSGTALTNDPFFNEMPPVAASADDATTEPTPTKEEPTMKPEFLKRMKAALKVAEETDDEALCAAIEAKCSAGAVPDHHLAAAAIPSEMITAAVAPLKAQVEAMMKENDALKASALDRDVDAAIEAGKKGDGKLGRAITADLRGFILATAKSSGLEEAKKLIAALPLSIPLAAIGHDTAPVGGVLTASDATARLGSIRDENVAKGMSRVAAMEAAIEKNPDLAQQARSLTIAVHAPSKS